MNSADVVGYAFHAALYCVDCGEDLPKVDPEGNDKSPVFLDDAQPEDCWDSCGELLIPE